MHQGDSGDGAAPSGYVVADESSCSGDLSFDDRDLGLNNQLASISYMLCTANVTRACSLNAPPLGYIPCGPHMPGTWTGPRGKRVCHVASTRDAAVDMRQLLRFPPDIDALLQRGAAHRSMMRNMSGAAERFIGRCMRNETDCQTCGPYNDNPFKCAQNAIAKGARVNMISKADCWVSATSLLFLFPPIFALTLSLFALTLSLWWSSLLHATPSAS